MMSILQIVECPTSNKNVAVKIKILEHAGPVVNLRTLRNKYNSSKRPPKDAIEDAMADLQHEGLGDFIRSGNNSAFIKQVPNKVNESENLTPYKMSIGQYTSAFCRKNYDLPNNLRGSLLSKSILDEAITNFFEEEKEKQST